MGWSSSMGISLVTGLFKILQPGQHRKCHRHGRLCDYRSTLFFILLSPTLHPTLVDLIFLSYLIYSRDPYLILPIYLHVHSHTFLIFLPNALVYSMTSPQEQREKLYLLVRRRTVLLGQLKGDLGSHQLVGQHLDLLLDGHESTQHRNRNGHLILLDL